MRGGLFLFLLVALAGLWRWRMNEAQLVLAQTIYGEARGEGSDGMAAVASVVMNRARIGGWWGDSVIAVCKAPWQFSTWNANDPNRALIEAKRPGAGDAAFDDAWAIAGLAIAGGLSDSTGGATHYYNPAVANPQWASAWTPTASLGNHVFGVA